LVQPHGIQFVANQGRSLGVFQLSDLVSEGTLSKACPDDTEIEASAVKIAIELLEIHADSVDLKVICITGHDFCFPAVPNNCGDDLKLTTKWIPLP
jgi:hypothetical protein